MKKIMIILFITVSQVAYCQTLVGVWQKNSADIGSGYQDCYHFFNNGSFIYYLSEYDAMKRILAIRGTYKTEKTMVQFKVISSVELEGGTISKTTSSTVHNCWTLIDFKGFKEIKLKPSTVKSPFKPCKSGNDKELNCMLIDDDRFYKISDSPEDKFKK